TLELADAMVRDFPQLIWLPLVRDQMLTRMAIDAGRRGETARADAVARRKDLSPMLCYNLACAYALAAAAGSSAEDHARSALDWLARAAGAGYFRSLREVDHPR